MTPTTIEWVDKAEADLSTAKRESRVRMHPNYDGVCFHAQQCAEKYLKGRLQEAAIRFPKTHDLLELLNLCLQVEPLREAMRHHLELLNPFTSLIRYSGIQADKARAKNAMVACSAVREVVRQSLKLD